MSRPLTGRLGHLVPGDATLYLIPVNLPVLCLAIPALLCGLHVSEAPGEPPGGNTSKHIVGTLARAAA